MTLVSFRKLLMPCALALAACLPQAAAAQNSAASSAPAAGTAEAAPATPAARPADVASIDAILKAAYDVISGPKGHQRDWDRLRSLFAPGARLIPTHTGKDGITTARVLSVDEFIRFADDPELKKNGFFEDELHRTVQRFGSVAQVFSTYETRHEAAGKAFQRGINSIQLLFDGHRWWIMTIYWQGERPDLPIPKQYGG